MDILELKKISEEWLPPVLRDALLRAFHSVYFQLGVNKQLLAKNKQLKGIGRGKRAFLCATGPSLKKENLKLLAGEDCFSLSNFFLHEDIEQIHPKFQFFAPYHKPLIRDNFAEWLRNSDEKLPPETKIFLGTKDESFVKEYTLFPNREVFYLYFNTHPSRRRVNILHPVRRPQTIPLMVLPVLLYMEYDQIYLLGCDHNALRNFGTKIDYFYKPKEEIRKKITGDYWESIIIQHMHSMKVFIQYEIYKKIIQKRKLHTEIINLSEESWLDTFPKDRLENII